MFRSSFDKRPVIEESQVISAGNCVRNYLLDVKPTDFNLNKEEGIIELIKRIENSTFFNLKKERYNKTEYSEPNHVKMTYTKSNLGKGFVFWFICNLCGRRVKFLYFPPNSQLLACRRCHRLSYEQQNKSKDIRKFSSLLKY